MLLYESPSNNKLADMALQTSKNMASLNEENVATHTNEEKSPRWPLQISLPSPKPILCTSGEVILVDHLTTRKNRFVLIDQNRKKTFIRSPINDPVLEVIWVEQMNSFLLLTANMIWTLDLLKGEVQKVTEIQPRTNRTFKTFALINLSILIVGYDEWNTETLDRWRLAENSKKWNKIDSIPIHLEEDEFIGHLSTDVKHGEDAHLIVPIYNDTSKVWRIEFRDLTRYECVKEIRSPHLQSEDDDLKVLPVYNQKSNVDFLIYFPGTTKILAVNKDWLIMHLENKYPVEELTIFKTNYFIIRTTKNLDVHFII